MSVSTLINIGMHIHEATEPTSSEQQRVTQLKQLLDQARLHQKRVKLNCSIPRKAKKIKTVFEPHTGGMVKKP